MKRVFPKAHVLAPAALLLIAAAPQDNSGASAAPPASAAVAPVVQPTPIPTPAPSATPLVRPKDAGPMVSPTPRPTASAPAAVRSQPARPRVDTPPRALERRETPAAASSSAPEADFTPVPLATTLPAEPLKPAYQSLPGPVVAPPPPAPGLATSVEPKTAEGLAGWIVPVAIVVLLGLGGAYFAWKRRGRKEMPRQPVATRADIPPPPPPLPALVRAPELQPVTTEGPRFWAPAHPVKTPDAVSETVAAAAPPRPRIEMEIVPKRAGLNLLSATAELELILRNVGDAPATEIAVDVRLLNTSAAQDAALGALFAAAMGKSVVPPFAIEAGSERSIRAVATIPRTEIEPLIAAERPMFVPMVAVDVRYDRGDDSRGQTAAAYAIGIRRDNSEKLGPFWLDGPPRMFDLIAARPHSFAVSS